MTDKITDLNEFRNAKAEPDADCRTVDEYGKPIYTFLLDYEMDGRQYTAEILAYDEEEAERRVEAMRATLTYGGKLFSRLHL